MKTTAIVNYLGWASGIFGALLMLSGVIGFLTGTAFLGVERWFNFFFIANSFLVLGIFLLVGTRCFCCCKDEEKEKAK